MSGSKIPLKEVSEHKEAKRLSLSDGRYVTRGNTHRKSLVCDDQFAVVTSFNWLSYKGDSQGSPRDERGIVFRKKHHVERLVAEELDLLGKGYAGASRAGAAARVK